MNNEDLVKNYMELFFSENTNYEEIRKLLCDGFAFSGPLLNASNADQYIETLKAMGSVNMKININSIISHLNEVAVLYDFVTPFGNHPTVEWFWIDNNKISAIKLLNDPRPFLEIFDKNK